jgi:hypothetical protein
MSLKPKNIASGWEVSPDFDSALTTTTCGDSYGYFYFYHHKPTPKPLNFFVPNTQENFLMKLSDLTTKRVYAILADQKERFAPAPITADYISAIAKSKSLIEALTK